MNLPPLNLLYVTLAAAPIIAILYLMIGRKWGGSKAGFAGLLIATAVAIVGYGAGGMLLLVAWGKSLLLSVFVLYVIWMALLLYHTVNEAGVIQAIGRELPGLADDRPGQALLLAWVFASFIQGATGFGVPAAVVAPLVVGLGFAPNAAVVVGLLGHAWAVSFGSLGSSFISLLATTGLPGDVLAGPSAALLGLCCFLCGLGVLWLVGGREGLRTRWGLLLTLSLAMGLTQWVLAVAGLWTLAALGGGVAGLVVAITWLARGRAFAPRPLLIAFAPYLLLIAVVGLGTFVFAEPLNRILIAPEFPAVSTRIGWATPAGPGRSISLFGHAGALLLYASLLIYGWFRLRGPLPNCNVREYSGRVIARKAFSGSIQPTLAVLALVAMGATMEHAGMTQTLALAISAAAGPLFPLLSPFIGALGSFMTGSNTNSNVVFAGLQMQTAASLDLPMALILAAQTAGGAIGSVFAPAKVVVGVSTVAGADEGWVLRTVTFWGVGILAVIGLVVLIASR